MEYADPFPRRRRHRRRTLLASLLLPALPAALQGCAEPLPRLTSAAPAPAARALLAESAAAHGSAALSAISDVSVSYVGEWRAIVGRLQPALVDSGFRGRSEERLLLPAPLDGQGRLVAGQAHAGPQGRKQVFRRTGSAAATTAAPDAQGDLRVWFNGGEARDAERRAAAALVADGYSFFLLGPMLLARQDEAGRPLVMERAGDSERITLHGGSEHECDVLRVRLLPGLGFSEADDLALFIDRADRLMRRVRFSLNGLDSTRSAVAEVDAYDHVIAHGVRWPTRFHERLLRPLPLPVHDWRLTGLDVNRGLDAAEIDGPAFTGRAVPPAAALA